MSGQSEDEKIPENGSDDSVVELFCDDCDAYFYGILHPSQMATNCGYENALQEYKSMLNKLYMDLSNRDMIISELRDQHLRMRTYCKNCLQEIKNLRIRYKTAVEELENFKKQYEILTERKVEYLNSNDQALESLLKTEVQRWNKESMAIHNQIQSMNADIQRLIQIVMNESNKAAENASRNQVDPIEQLVANQTAILTLVASKVEQNVNAINDMKRCPCAGCEKSMERSERANVNTVEHTSTDNNRELKTKETQTETLIEPATFTEIISKQMVISENENSPAREKESERSVSPDNLDNEEMKTNPQIVSDTVKDQVPVIENIIEKKFVSPLTSNHSQSNGEENEMQLSEPFEIIEKKIKCYCGNTELCPDYMKKDVEIDFVACQMEAQNTSEFFVTTENEEERGFSEEAKEQEKSQYSSERNSASDMSPKEEGSLDKKDKETIIVESLTPLLTEKLPDTNETISSTKSGEISNQEKLSVEPQIEQVTSISPRPAESESSDRVDLTYLPDCCKSKGMGNEAKKTIVSDNFPDDNEKTLSSRSLKISQHYDLVFTQREEPYSEEQQKYEKMIGANLFTSVGSVNLPDTNYWKLRSNSAEPINTQIEETYSEEPQIKQISSIRSIPAESKLSDRVNNTTHLPDCCKVEGIMDNAKTITASELLDQVDIAQLPDCCKNQEKMEKTIGANLFISVRSDNLPDTNDTKLSSNSAEPINTQIEETYSAEPRVEHVASISPSAAESEKEVLDIHFSKPSIPVEKEPESQTTSMIMNNNQDNVLESMIDTDKVLPNEEDEGPVSEFDPHKSLEIEKEIIEEVQPVEQIDPVQHIPSQPDFSGRKEVPPVKELEIPPFLEQFISIVTKEIENIKIIIEKRDLLLQELKGDFQNNQNYISHENSELITKIQLIINDLPNWICGHSVFKEIQNRLNEVEQIMKKMQSLINELKIRFESAEFSEQKETPLTEMKKSSYQNTKIEEELKILNELLDKMKTLEKCICGCSRTEKDEKRIKDQIKIRCKCKKDKNK